MERLNRNTVRRVLLVASVALSASCGSNQPPPATPPSVSAPPPSDPATRALTESECESLAQWIVDACRERASLRSAQDDGWCGEVERGTTAENRSWLADCVKHVTYIDNACFRGTTSVRSLMSCDST